MSTIGENIKKYRKNKDLTQFQLAEKSNMSRSYLGDIENNRYNPSLDTLKNIADALNIDISLLISNNVVDNDIDVEHLDKIPISKVGIKIPVVGRVQAGIPVEAIEEVIDYEEITADMAKTGEFFGLKIKGNSMEPVFYENDVVIVKKQPDVENGEIAIVLVNGDDATVKKIKKVENGIMLIPTNAIYEPIFFTNEQILNIPVNIIGKVVELRRSF